MRTAAWGLVRKERVPPLRYPHYTPSPLVQGWFFGDWLTGPGLAKFTDGRRELLAPRPFNAGGCPSFRELSQANSPPDKQTSRQRL